MQHEEYPVLRPLDTLHSTHPHALLEMEHSEYPRTRRLSIVLIPTRGLQHSLGLESSESLLVTRDHIPANHVLLSHSPRSVWSILLLCMRTRGVCTVVGLAIPRTTYSAVLLLLMSAHMIPGTMMLAIGVMPRNHDPGDHGCRTSFFFFSCPRTVYSTTPHCITPPVEYHACSVTAHTPSPSPSNDHTHDPWITRLAIWCNDPQP